MAPKPPAGAYARQWRARRLVWRFGPFAHRWLRELRLRSPAVALLVRYRTAQPALSEARARWNDRRPWWLVEDDGKESWLGSFEQFRAVS